MSIVQQTASEFLRSLESGEISSVELTQAYLDRIRAVDTRVGAFLRVDENRALKRAADVDSRRSQGKPLGRLAGLPVAVKDVLCDSEELTTCASRMLANFRPPYDSTVVAKLKSADAVLIGRTNMDEFAMGGSTENSAFQLTHNPWDLERTPGGSSGGAAACVAAGMAPLSIGTDTGGSIRQPAGLCGIVGMKPTYGRVSRYGLVAFASSLDQVGPLAQTVGDAALLLDAIAGHDPRDSTSLNLPTPNFAATVDEPLKGLRIGWAREHFAEGLDGEVETAVRAAFKVYESLGAKVEPISLPHGKYGVATYYVIAPSEASSNLARYDGVHFGYRTDEQTMLSELAAERKQLQAAKDERGLIDLDTALVRMYRRTRAEGFGAEVKRRIMLGTYALSAGYYDAYYLKALKVRRLIRQDFDRAFAQVDLIAGPITASPAFKLGEMAGDPLSMYLVDLYTVSANLAGIPGVCLPCGRTKSGLPIGLQLQAPALEEDRLLRGARMYERATDWHRELRTLVTARIDMSQTFTTVVGLEVHVQLATESKLFCRCSTRFGAEPNTQTCPVCIGMPGTLPVMNREAVRLALKTALALDCEIPERTKWDRKQYYYPDLPKGYQISQYDLPLSQNGHLEISDPKGRFASKRVGIIRAHLEEDAGKSIHDEVANKADSVIDLNRTGTPLLEIVSEPDMRGSAEAGVFLKELKLLLTYLGVSDCNMQEGSLRVDANINLHIDTPGGKVATPIVEIKNMNSFRAVERALDYEAQRQYDQWQETGQLLGQSPKQTRGWDDEAGITRGQRSKEESSDYRYLPDPDLVPVAFAAAEINEVRASLGELPVATRKRLEDQYGLPAYDAEVLVNQGLRLVQYFTAVAESCGDGKAASNWVTQDVLRTLKDRNVQIEQFSVPSSALADLIVRIRSGELPSVRAREAFQAMVDTGGDVATAMRTLGIEGVDESVLASLCEQLVAANPRIVADVRNGKLQALGALVGQAKKSNPNVDPNRVREICLKLINNPQA